MMRQVSLLLANGHPDAADYPLPRVFDEAEFVVERKNGEFATMAIVIQQATSTTGMNATPKVFAAFKKFIKGLTGDE